MPAIEMLVYLERSVGGKTKIKAYAEAFSITGFIRRETSSTCCLRMESAKKSSIIDCLVALYNELEDSTDFYIMTETVQGVGRRTYTQFTIIESQDWKKSRDNNELSSDSDNIVYRRCFNNRTLTETLEKLLYTVYDSESETNTIDSSPIPKKLKYSLYEDAQRYYIEVLAPHYSPSDFRISFSNGKLTIQTAEISNPLVGKKKISDGFSYGSNTITEITLPPNAGFEVENDTSLSKGILRLSIKKRKHHEQIVIINEM